MANGWSGPLNFLFRVMCFSITFAPNEIDAKALKLSTVWSEKPVNTLNFFGNKVYFLNLSDYFLVDIKNYNVRVLSYYVFFFVKI